ncbi:MAG: hypothetical protein IKU17_10905, partial [Clostridia bacterium]|nr:hypothetical protein [Clostridia bacterium]
MKLFKRALPLCMALVMVLSMVTTPLTGTAMAAGYKPGQFTVQANHVSADQLHPFTSSQELIWDMIQELKAQNITQVEEEPDEDLVASVEEATEMTYETVKNTIATDLKDSLSAGKFDVSAFGLDLETMSAVMEEILNEYYMYNAVSDLKFTTRGGKVTRIGFDVSEGYAAAMEAMGDEFANADVEVDVDTNAAQNAVDTMEAAPVATFGMRAACQYHTLLQKLLGDYNEDGNVTSTDARMLLFMTTGADIGHEYTLTTQDDLNGDGEYTSTDARMLLVKSTAGEDLGYAGSAEPEFTWVQAMDYSPVFYMDDEGYYLTAEGARRFRMDENYCLVDEAGNMLYYPDETGTYYDAATGAAAQPFNDSIANGGLLYNGETGEITTGILPSVYHQLTTIEFDCGVCGEHIVYADDPETEEDEMANFSMAQDIYIKMTDYSTVAVNVGEKPVLGEGETEDMYMHYTEMQIGTFMDDSFYAGLTPLMDENGNFLNAEGQIVEDPSQAVMIPPMDENGNYIGMFTSDPQDNGAAEVVYYYSVLSAFNQDHADYFGVSTDYWTSKNTEANPMAALKTLCNLDPDQDIPPAQMIQMVQMLPQAFMAYVYYYGGELLAMRDACMEVVDALPNKTTDVQKLLVIHDWLAENAVF